jgi:hypothetical protein
MRKSVWLVITLLTVGAVGAANTPPKPASAKRFPRLHFHFHAGFDAFHCESAPGGIPKRWTKDAADHLSHFSQLWEKRGEPLLRRTIESTGREFKRSEETAFMILCPDKPGMARPLILQFAWYLPVPTGDLKMKTLSEDSFLTYVFHEVLHTYLQDNALDPLSYDGEAVKPLPTPLLRRYSSEIAIVLQHLHVASIMKSVFLSLNEKELLQETLDFEKKDPSMARVWEIIEDPAGPGAAGFLAEIKK